MLRNKALAQLQRTYDESYLSCSTAVYYEGQGNESEAMRCWRNALDQISDHQVGRALASYPPRSETENALVDSLRELELQCKERIDLLEALRLSRQEDVGSVTASGPNARNMPVSPTSNELDATGWIGQGTIPAVTYTELSRPDLPPRPVPPPRAVSSGSITGANTVKSIDKPSLPSYLPTSQSSLSAASKSKERANGKTMRSPSPEKHKMRATLRPGKAAEKISKTKNKRPVEVSEGPGKAATVAWSATSSRARLGSVPSSDPAAASAAGNSFRTLSEQPHAPSNPTGSQWDSHSRRLVVPNETDVSTVDGRRSDEYSYSRPSLLSVSAASSALNLTAGRDFTTAESPSGTEPPSRHAHTPLKSHSAKVSRPELGRGSMDQARSKTTSGSISQRKSAGEGSSKSTRPATSEGKRRESQNYRSPSTSSLSLEDQDGTADKIGPRRSKNAKEVIAATSLDLTSGEEVSEDSDQKETTAWKKRVKRILRNLPPGVDEHSAKQILHEVVVQGDEVHWGDIAGLEIAKNALRENVVYPFLRPDLFMGLREPARGMLLFGPPGTGKTMLARAVATESRSTFFSISASSLTSKYLGESEKLVRALFALAKTLAPSIIFVDEIDSLLSQRSGSGEHEATRRIKTEFLIQWSDLQRAAAGRDVSEKERERGDATRVLVLAATNLPWAIDEAARRRFVRRQYIPLPEGDTRAVQFKTLLGQQKHTLSDADIDRLVELTDGFSGSDITALAKDAAMGPLRSLGEALLHMTMDQIRPIALADFLASLTTIRPSVSKAGLKEYEDWAREFGERGG